MIISVNKWHRTESGEAFSSVKVDKETEIDCYREAKKQAYLFCSNYMADKTVLDWTVSLYNPKTMRVEMPESYFTPDAPVVEDIVE